MVCELRASPRRGCDESNTRWILFAVRNDGESTCRRDSVPGEPGGDHPSLRPTRGCRVATADGSPVPLLDLAPGGVYQPPGSPRTLVRSYRTVSPLPVTPGEPVAHRRFALCCTSVRSPQPGSRQLRTLWSPDLPQRTGVSTDGRGHPDDSPSLAVYVCRTAHSAGLKMVRTVGLSTLPMTLRGSDSTLSNSVGSL